MGVRVPVYPVKGFSIAVPLADATKAPKSTITRRVPEVDTPAKKSPASH